MDYGQKDLVEAIEDGRIVKVPESYAKREGLLILKKSPLQVQKQQPPSYLTERKEHSDRTKPLTDYIRSRPDWREKQVLSELIDNFNWQIRYNRRRLGLTRKQLARMINVPEEELQILESGRLPSNDFILINKVQKVLGVNLRKDGKQFDISAEELMHKAATSKNSAVQTKAQRDEVSRDIVGKDIEIIDEE